MSTESDEDEVSSFKTFDGLEDEENGTRQGTLELEPATEPSDDTRVTFEGELAERFESMREEMNSRHGVSEMTRDEFFEYALEQTVRFIP